jgi:hypothetical protein
VKNFVLGAVIGGLAVGHLKGKITIDLTFTHVLPPSETVT